MHAKINMILPLGVALVFLSCNKSPLGEADPPVETRALMNVSVLQQNGLAEDKMKTVRFIVFDEGSNKLELNELFEIPDPSAGQEVSRFDIVLEVKKKAVSVNTKRVVAIINEPTPLSSGLSNITNYSGLTEMELDFAYFLNTEHTALGSNRLMPMTGVIVTDKIYDNVPQAQADPVKLSVNRAVSRVDIYLNKAAGLDIELATGTEISLGKTYDRQYLLCHRQGSIVYGNIQTVSSGWLTKNWQLQSSDSPALPVKTNGSSGRLVCSFYTPERTCFAVENADKLIVNLKITTDEGATRTGKVVIDRFRLEGVDTDVNQITRNNIYKVVTTVGANVLTSTVLDWNSENIETEF